MKNILAFDVGTTAMKCILFNESFKEISSVSMEYAIETSSDGIAELDAEKYYESFCECVNKMKHYSIDAICFTTQGETFIPIDTDGKAISKAIVWLDTRAEEEALFIRENLSIEKIYSVTGLCDIDGALPLAKILWLRKNKPDIYEKTDKFLLLEDYLIFRLTGKKVSEKSLQSSTGWYDIANEKFFDEALALCGIDRNKLPEILSCGSIVGKVSENLVLSPDTIVVTGAMDQISSAIGAGNICEGIVTETTGTALVVGATVEKPEFDLNTPVTVYKHYDEKFIYMPYSATAGIVLKWFRDTVMPQVIRDAEKKGVSSYKLIDEIAEKSPAGSNGVIMNPDFTNGGGFYNLTLATTQSDLARSVLEGVSYMLRDLLEPIEKCGTAVDKILSLGGGSYSRLWGEIKASVCGKEIECVKYGETTALGAAILAAVAIGAYKSVEDAIGNIKNSGNKYKPDSEKKAVYEKCYLKYKEYIKNGG